MSRTRPSGDQDGAPKRRAGAVAAAVAAAVLLFTVGHAGSRLASAGDGTDGGLGARLDEWALAASVVADHPLVGAGPEGYRVVAPGHIDDAYARRHGRDDLVDRAHSAPLDVAAAGGLPAAALYVALLALVVAACVRAIRLPAPHPVVVGAAAGLTAWVVQQVVAFPIAEVDPVAWLLAGVVAAAVAVPPGATAVAAVPSIDRVGRAGRLVGGGCAAVLLVGGALAVWTDVSLARAERLAADGDDAAALVAADRATRLRPDDVDGWYVAARLAAERTSLLGVDAALDRVEAGRARLPTDPALRDLEERLLVERALRSGLPEDRRAAERASRRAVAADPSGPAHYRSLGLVLAAGGHDEAAASALRRALDLDPGDRTSRDAPTAPDPGDRTSRDALDAQAALDPGDRRSGA